MTSLGTVRKEVEKLRQKVKPKRENRIVVHMWMPGGKDHDDPDNLIVIKATNRGETI